MMLWVGIALLIGGIPSLAIDRRAALFFRDHLQPPALSVLLKTTDWAKGGPWIIGAGVLYLATLGWTAFYGESAMANWASDVALALLASLVVGSIVLHSFKIFLGRRRPRDDFEHGLYGFVFFTWSLQHNSFPSGHALTIFCVATWATALAPTLIIVWLAVATYLGLSRAILAVHFLSDVLIGAGIGVLATRATMRFSFPHLLPAWF